MEKGNCLLKFSGKLKCEYFDNKEKEIVINNKKLAITQKRYNKTYRYPIAKSPFLNILYKEFEVIAAHLNGQIVLKIERAIPANERGLFLLKLEENLKSSVDRGITVWCEPVGDKSKLRNLRGIKFSK